MEATCECAFNFAAMKGESDTSTLSFIFHTNRRQSFNFQHASLVVSFDQFKLGFLANHCTV